MAEPFDHRDITFTGGGTRAAKVGTDYDTSRLAAPAKTSGVASEKNLGTPENGETTWHDVRIFDNAGGVIAKMVYRRVAKPVAGAKVNHDHSRHNAAPTGNFTATTDLTGGGDAVLTEETDVGNVSVTLWVTASTGFSKSVSAANGVITIKIKEGSRTVHLATLEVSEA